MGQISMVKLMQVDACELRVSIPRGCPAVGVLGDFSQKDDRLDSVVFSTVSVGMQHSAFLKVSPAAQVSAIST